MIKKISLLLVSWALIITILYFPKKRYNAFENRYLETFSFPSFEEVVSLEWMDDFETALCEQFNLRNFAITIKTTIDKALGKTDNGRVYFGKDGYLFGMEEDLSYLDKNIETLNSLGTSSISIDFIPVYTSLCALNDLAPNNIESVQLTIMNYLKENLENVKIIDTFDVVEGETSYYYKTDHHWSMTGAKAVYEYYMNKESMDDLISVSEDFKGTYYYQAPSFFSTTDTILSTEDKEVLITYSDGSKATSLYQPSYLETTDAYRYYLGGNDGRVEIETSTKNGKKLLVIKDSYANCFVPFLCEDYQYITMIDLRYGLTNLNEELQKDYERCLVIYGMMQFCQDEYLSQGG